MTKTNWKKSTYSAGDSPNCVETREGVTGGAVVDVDIADSKDPKRSTIITVAPAAWTSFASWAATDARVEV